jgi:hypothetical protein
METAVVDTATAQPRRFVERRRAGSVPPRGMVFVERRRPAPVFVLEADDLHAADHAQVLAEGLDYGFGVLDRDAAAAAATALAGLIGPAALAAHALSPAAAELLG